MAPCLMSVKYRLQKLALIGGRRDIFPPFGLEKAFLSDQCSNIFIDVKNIGKTSEKKKQSK